MTQTITSLAILNVLMHPLARLIFVIPQSYAALGCFRRIEEFLASSSWTDKRLSVGETINSDSRKSPAATSSHNIEMRALPTKQEIVPARADWISVKDASFGWQDSSPVVEGINMQITDTTQLTLILGPVGCGKSTLLKGLLGEALILNGVVCVATKEMSFCDHNPWLVNGSIRENIIGGSEYDKGLYDSVIYACALDTDLTQFPDGDETHVGSKGVTLSGGQKQRIVSIDHCNSCRIMA